MMVKKILSLAIILVLIFSLAACDNGTELANYKTEAKEAIDTYAKVNDIYYTTETFAIVWGIVSQGKTAIDTAADKTAVDSAVATAKQEIDSVEQTEGSLEGVFTITDTSWEAYVRRIAESDGEDEDWIQKVLNDGIYMSKNAMRVYILDNKIRVYPATMYTDSVYQFSNDEDFYIGDGINTNIAFTLSGNILTVKLTAKDGTLLRETQHRRDASIKTTAETVQLNTPQDGDSSFIFVYLDNTTSFGVLGACIELKYPGEQDFTRTIITHREMGAMYAFHIADLKLVEGINIVRVTYLGGPCLINGGIGLSITSESLYLTVTKDSAGIITVEDFE